MASDHSREFAVDLGPAELHGIPGIPANLRERFGRELGEEDAVIERCLRVRGDAAIGADQISTAEVPAVAVVTYLITKRRLHAIGLGINSMVASQRSVDSFDIRLRIIRWADPAVK